MRKIPSTMVSQHPDHASKPYWHNEPFISTKFESHECFLSFSELGADEYKWDWEGKFVDEAVMERLFGEHFDYFQNNQLGKDKFLTFRIPNPKVETEFRLGRAFMGLLAASALAKHVGLHTPPLFEVIVPMVETAAELIELQEAFVEMATLKHKLYKLENGTLKHIEIVPLFEDVHTIIHSDEILAEYIASHQKVFGFKPASMRPYVARSDPALNSGLVPTILAIKVALSRYKDFAEQTGIALYPIIGSASLPFRGGLTPHTVEKFAAQYSGIRTALIQSAFRYDYAKADVIAALQQLQVVLPQGVAMHISKAELAEVEEVIPFFEAPYRQTIEHIADKINLLASYLPPRRERVQHIGLFGYSRGVGKVKLPRAIGFTAALYSLGVPPELIGTGRGLIELAKKGKTELVEKLFINLRSDLIQAGKYLNKNVLSLLATESTAWQGIEEDVKGIEQYLGVDLGPQSPEDKMHAAIVENIYKKITDNESVTDLITQAAIVRKSLG